MQSGKAEPVLCVKKHLKILGTMDEGDVNLTMLMLRTSFMNINAAVSHTLLSTSHTS